MNRQQHHHDTFLMVTSDVFLTSTFVFAFFAILLLALLIQLQGGSTSATSFEKKMHWQENDAGSGESMLLKRLVVVVRGQDYYVDRHKHTLAELERMMKAYTVIEVIPDASALHMAVNRVESMASRHHLRVFERSAS